MTQHHAHEGNEAHDHPHPQGPPPLPLDTSQVFHATTPPPPGITPEVEPVQMQNTFFNEIIAAKALDWFANEFIGGLVAVAEARGVKLEDFLAERCAILAMRVARLEGELTVVRTQAQAIKNQLDDCGCHDEAVTQTGEGTAPTPPPVTNNGAGA